MLAVVFFVVPSGAKAASELQIPAACPYESLGITLDEYEVPMISGDSLEAVFFGAGYVQAYHRLVQMDGTRRLARGELAGLIGEALLNNDRMMRRLSLSEVAEESLKLLTDEELAALQAYTDGVNSYIEELSENPDDLPTEFMLSGPPRKWQPADTLVCARLMSWMLMDDFFATVSEEKRKTKLDPELFELIDMPSNESIITHVAASDLPQKYVSLASVQTKTENASHSLTPKQDTARGSNCFAVSGDLTSDGRPLLASDPHLELTFPPIWYEMRYDSPALNARGMSVPGTPIIVIGANLDVAWGITSLGGDVSDAIRYPARGLDDENGGEYQTTDGWKPFKNEKAEFEIAGLMGNRTETETIRFTESGPVFYAYDESVIVLKWVGMLPDRENASFLALNLARNISEVRSAACEMTTSQNIVVVSADNHIAHIPVGKHPVRSYDGSVMVDGSTTNTTWSRFLTTADFPMTVDPDCGYIVSANQQIYPAEAVFTSSGANADLAGISFDEALGGYRSFGHRATIITGLLEDAKAEGPITPEILGRIQCDTYSQLGVGFRDFVIETLEEAGFAAGAPDNPVRAAYDTLEFWDGRCDADSGGACVAFLVLENVANRILSPRNYKSTRERAWHGAFDYGRKLGKFWDDPETEDVEDAAMILAWALEESAAHLEDTLGPPDEWRWADLHLMDLSYPVPFIGMHAPGLVGAPGGWDTPWQGSSYLGDDGYFIQDFAPSMRLIATPGEFSEGFLSVLPGGQSGDVTEPHSRDQLVLFLAGGYK